jgi:hypothetical protein
MSNRNYLIFEDAVRDETLRPYFDVCAAGAASADRAGAGLTHCLRERRFTGKDTD